MDANGVARRNFPLTLSKTSKHSILVHMQQKLPRLPFPDRVYKRHRLSRVPVVNIVGRELVIPSQFPGVCTDIVRAGISRAPIDEIEARVIRTRGPGRSATVLQGLTDPVSRAWFPPRGVCVKPPYSLSRRCFVSVEKSRQPPSPSPTVFRSRVRFGFAPTDRSTFEWNFLCRGTYLLGLLHLPRSTNNSGLPCRLSLSLLFLPFQWRGCLAGSDSLL